MDQDVAEKVLQLAEDAGLLLRRTTAMLQVGCIKVSDVNRTFYVVSSEEDGILAAFEVKADEFVRAGVEIESKPVRWTQLSPTEIEMIKAGNTDFVRQ